MLALGILFPNGDDVHPIEQTAVGHKQFHNKGLLPVVIVFLILSYVSVALRLWTRAHFLKRLGWDDYLIIVAVVSVHSVQTSAYSDQTTGFVQCILRHCLGHVLFGR